MLIGDHIRLKQVLINLTKNALKFTVNGQIKIVAAYDKVKQMLKVQVIDSGKGITNQEMGQLFSRFGKLQRTESMNIEGLGLGLKICQQIVIKSGGEIEAYSEGENKGTTFMFSMKMLEFNSQSSDKSTEDQSNHEALMNKESRESQLLPLIVQKKQEQTSLQEILENSEIMNDDSKSAVKLGQARNQEISFDFQDNNPFSNRKLITYDDLSVNLGDFQFD